MCNRHRASQLIVEVMPKFMRSLASDWRHMEHSPNEGHFRALIVLARGATNLSDLANKLEVSLPTMSNTITTLSERNWVVRRRDPDDRRRVLVELTPEGCEVLEYIRDFAEEHVAQTLAPLSEEECESVVHSLLLLSRVFDDGNGSCIADDASSDQTPAD